MNDQLPAHDPKAEWSLLSCALHKPELITALVPELFYQTTARTVLAAMKKLKDEKRESTHRPETFEHDLMLILPPAEFGEINAALNELPSPSGWAYWMEIVRDHQRARALTAMQPKLGDIADGLLRGDRIGLLDAQRQIQEIIGGGGGAGSSQAFQTMDLTCDYVLAEIEDAWTNGAVLKGYNTGFPDINAATRGFQRKKLYVFAGRPGEGKSSLLMQFAWTAQQAGLVLFFSLEMPTHEIVERLASNISRVPITRFTRQNAEPTDFSRFGAAIRAIRSGNVRFIDNVSDLASIASICHENRELLKMVVLDYLQRIRIPNFRGNRNELVTEISVTAKDLAMNLEVPVLAAAQLNRASEKEGRPPNLADLRDSGSIEQDADFVGFLHPPGGETKTMTDLLVAKNRAGDRERVDLHFVRECFRFESAAKVSQEDAR